MSFKPSIYNFYFDIENKEVGIFNCLTKALLVLDSKKCEKLKYNNSALPVSIKETLIKNGILVSTTANEHEMVNIIRAKSIYNALKSVYRIFTTTDCNARCFYCYEKNTEYLYMSENTAIDVAEFIIQHVENRSCLIQWFGGEPLMNMKVIEIISTRLRDVLGDDRVTFMMITNGSLISDEVISKMIDPWNIKRVQISLDGAYENYNYRKNYVSILDSFDVVLQNVKRLLENDIYVSLRINYDAENYKMVPELVNILAQKFRQYNNLHVYTYHLFEMSQNANGDPLVKKEWFSMQQVLIEAGFLEPLEAYSLTIRNMQCFACSAKSFVIMPDGRLYKCAIATKDKSACIGSIDEGIINYSVFERWCDPSLREECASCTFLPLCQGGCRAGVLGYMSERCFTQKEFAADVLRERLKYLKISSKQEVDCNENNT